MKPCPCGYLGDHGGRCRCTPDQVQRYRSRLSGPLLDRIDLQIEVPPVPRRALLETDPQAESSEVVRARVCAAREIQLQRAAKPNRELSNREIERYCALAEAGQKLLHAASERLHLSARSTHRILKVARTIADLAGSADIEVAHLSEAVSYRRLETTAAAMN